MCIFSRGQERVGFGASGIQNIIFSEHSAATIVYPERNRKKRDLHAKVRLASRLTMVPKELEARH